MDAGENTRSLDTDLPRAYTQLGIHHTFMELLSFLKRLPANRPKNDILSEFFLYASDEEKIRVFTKAAHMANKDQQDIVNRSKKLQAT